jgi:hypothetical protein
VGVAGGGWVRRAQDWTAGSVACCFSISRGAERRSSGLCRDALTTRQQADMSLTLRVKHFQLSVKCKGEKITKVDFRGEYVTAACHSIPRKYFQAALIDS